MNYWMVKQEPEAYSWDDFVKDGKTDWTGVRNFQARNNLKAMKKGDKVLFYHSVSGKEVVGIAEVSKEGFPDPTDQAWTAVELKPYKASKKTGHSGGHKGEPGPRQHQASEAITAFCHAYNQGRVQRNT
jgi:predicted RNA-binding protein with PUA-like domain